jgi:TRAP-type C4-dicarboxylate transport system substrate-binding protein
VAETAEEATKIIYDMYDQYLAEDFKDYKVLWLYSCGGGQIITRNTPVRTAEDLKGMKVRAPSAYMSKSLRLLGSNPVGMPIAELAVSLQKAVIDGMLGPYSSIPDFRLAGLVKYVTEINLYVIPMAVLMNKKRWDSLPDFAKKAIDQASGRQWGLHAARIYDKQDADAVREIEKTSKIKIYRMSEAEIGKIRGALKPLEKDWVETMSKKGVPSRAILEAAYSTSAKMK